MQHLLDKSANVEPSFPKRSAFAWFLALFVPRIGFGSAGGTLVSMMIVVAIVASIALPAYQQFQKRAELASVSMPARGVSEQHAALDNPQKVVRAEPQAFVQPTPQARETSAQSEVAAAPAVVMSEEAREAALTVAKAQKAMAIASELKTIMWSLKGKFQLHCLS